MLALAASSVLAQILCKGTNFQSDGIAFCAKNHKKAGGGYIFLDASAGICGKKRNFALGKIKDANYGRKGF
jgi:hypothetical protein